MMHRNSAGSLGYIPGIFGIPPFRGAWIRRPRLVGPPAGNEPQHVRPILWLKAFGKRIRTLAFGSLLYQKDVTSLETLVQKRDADAMRAPHVSHCRGVPGLNDLDARGIVLVKRRYKLGLPEQTPPQRDGR